MIALAEAEISLEPITGKRLNFATELVKRGKTSRPYNTIRKLRSEPSYKREVQAAIRRITPPTPPPVRLNRPSIRTPPPRRSPPPLRPRSPSPVLPPRRSQRNRRPPRPRSPSPPPPPRSPSPPPSVRSPSPPPPVRSPSPSRSPSRSPPHPRSPFLTPPPTEQGGDADFDLGPPPSQGDNRSPSPPRTQTEADPPWLSALKAAISPEIIVDIGALVPESLEAQELVNIDLQNWLPPVPPKPKSNFQIPPLPLGKKKRRRALYARIQRWYRRNRVRCADSILEGSWDKEQLSLPMATQEPFWRGLLETPSVVDPRDPEQVRPDCWGLLKPATNAELLETLKCMDTKTSPGPDGIVLQAVKRLPIEELVAHINLWLLAGKLPARLCEGVTSLIPKSVVADDPSQYRPITVTSILCRLYHKVLANRLEAYCPHSCRQKAFRAGDGIAENTLLLQHVLWSAQNPEHPKPVYLAFLDVKKAFDSVSIQSVLLAAKRAGVPPHLLAYIRDFYGNSTTRLKVGDERSALIRVLQGVKQGDPLSCWLFNAVIDWALSDLDPNIGFRFGDSLSALLHSLAFADDVVLLASTKAGLQHQIQVFTQHLAKSGLFMNAKKCASISIVVRADKWVVDPAPGQFAVLGQAIPAMSVSDTYKYLGLHVSPNGTIPLVEEKLQTALSEISRAPLKPQQRLWILRVKVIPGLLHQLVLASGTLGQLKKLDRWVRFAVRRWLKLPNDTSIPSFYARTKDGGLGLQAVEHTVPALKVKRLIGLSASSDPAVMELVRSPQFQDRIRKWSNVSYYNNTPMTSKAGRDSAFAIALTSCVDGRGLTSAPLVPSAHTWVDSGTSLMSGAKFCAAIGVRLGTLPTRLRASRGRGGLAAAGCDCCGPGVLESLSHILQVCPRTHGVRIARHDRVLDQATRILSGRLGFTTVSEPHYNTSLGLRKPDLVAYKEGQVAAVLDATICYDGGAEAGGFDPDQPHHQKVAYYSQHPEIVNSVRNLSSTTDDPIFSSITINWRGCWSPASARDLSLLGFTKADLGLLAAIAVEQGAAIHRVFNQSTHRVYHRRPPRPPPAPPTPGLEL